MRLQFLKQMYVLVLGLDVLGNPFGLIRGLSEGVEAFFYEPFQVTHTYHTHTHTYHTHTLRNTQPQISLQGLSAIMDVLGMACSDIRC